MHRRTAHIRGRIHDQIHDRVHGHHPGHPHDHPHDERHQHDHHHHPDHHHARRDGGHGRRRARRGAVSNSVLALLAESPMHGYELITALEAKSGGRWKPSPGSIYPALRRLEHRGLITSIEGDDGKSRFELTDTGRARVAEHREAGHDAPWDDHGLGRHGDLRRAVAELTGPARQIGRFGTPEQTAAAVVIIKRATTELYRLLADNDEDDQETDNEDDEDATDVNDAT